MTHAAALYAMGIACVVLGLGVAWIQSQNHAIADELQRIERSSLDLQVRIEALDTECVQEIHRALAGEPPLDSEVSDDAPPSVPLEVIQ